MNLHHCIRVLLKVLDCVQIRTLSWVKIKINFLKPFANPAIVSTLELLCQFRFDDARALFEISIDSSHDLSLSNRVLLISIVIFCFDESSCVHFALIPHNMNAENCVIHSQRQAYYFHVLQPKIVVRYINMDHRVVLPETLSPFVYKNVFLNLLFLLVNPWKSASYRIETYVKNFYVFILF